MKTISTAALTGLIVVIIGTGVGIGQDAGTLPSEFRAAMRKSFELTKDVSYRNNVTVEMGSTSTTTEWQPYSSRVAAFSFPDRAHIIRTSRINGEFIQIGKVTYQTYQNGTWVRSEVQKDPSITNPAAGIGVGGPNFEFSKATPDSPDGQATVFRIVKNPEPGTKDFDKQVLTWTYWFDDKGILYKHESIGYNGTNWVRTTEVYEYDPTIKIEAPIINE